MIKNNFQKLTTYQLKNLNSQLNVPDKTKETITPAPREEDPTITESCSFKGDPYDISNKPMVNFERTRTNKAWLSNAGISDENINKYFDYKPEHKQPAYILKDNLVLNGKKISTIDDLLDYLRQPLLTFDKTKFKM